MERLLSAEPDARTDVDLSRLSDLFDVVCEAAGVDTFLHKLPLEAKVESFKYMSVTRLKPSQVLFRQGDPGGTMYVVLEGVVAVVILPDKPPEELAALRREAKRAGKGEYLGTEVSTMSVGGSFGELSIGDANAKRAASTRAGSAYGAVLMSIDSALYHGLLKRFDSTSDDVDVIVRYLRGMDAFRRWKVAKLNQIAYAMERRRVARGSLLAEAGRPAATVFLLVEGEVQLLVTAQQPPRADDLEDAALEASARNELPNLRDVRAVVTASAATQTADVPVQVALLGPGELVGHFRWKSAHPTFAYDARCTTEVEALCMPRDTLFRIVQGTATGRLLDRRYCRAAQRHRAHAAEAAQTRANSFQVTPEDLERAAQENRVYEGHKVGRPSSRERRRRERERQRMAVRGAQPLWR